MSDLSYSSEKIAAAVHALAIGRGRIKDRLEAAASDFARSSRTSMPSDETREFWDRVWGPLTAEPQDPVRGSVGASIDEMTEEQAVEVAQSIVSLDAMLRSIR